MAVAEGQAIHALQRRGLLRPQSLRAVTVAEAQLPLLALAPDVPGAASGAHRGEVAAHGQALDALQAGHGRRQQGVGLRAQAQAPQLATAPDEQLPLLPDDGAAVHGAGDQQAQAGGRPRQPLHPQGRAVVHVVPLAQDAEAAPAKGPDGLRRRCQGVPAAQGHGTDVRAQVQKPWLRCILATPGAELALVAGSPHVEPAAAEGGAVPMAPGHGRCGAQPDAALSRRREGRGAGAQAALALAVVPAGPDLAALQQGQHVVAAAGDAGDGARRREARGGRGHEHVLARVRLVLLGTLTATRLPTLSTVVLPKEKQPAVCHDGRMVEPTRCGGHTPHPIKAANPLDVTRARGRRAAELAVGTLAE
mmetsp:Transcript_12365/g.38710  ORF Transcript_12365/g.38710 Transcript_12365/m.38710 type:complete len:363 (+) Transcript_12365:150-1238(+)